jgi:hypothetical protein
MRRKADKTEGQFWMSGSKLKEVMYPIGECFDGTER